MVTPEGGTNSLLRKRLQGRAFYESIGSPKYVLAPMVDQSEFAWRMLVRSYLSPEEQSNLLCYTPMFHARLFAEVPKYRSTHYEPTLEQVSNADISITSDKPKDAPHLDGNPDIDRPLLVQFCANDPNFLRQGAALVGPYCDGVDLNLGCPQGIARKGHYGAFLQEDQDLIRNIIKTIHDAPESEIPIPVTAKIRILDTPEKTLTYARNVLSAGASILAVHGRQREQKGHLTGLADWAAIKRLRDEIPPEVVMFANGNILTHEDLDRCLEATGADGVLSAEGALSNPAIFSKPPSPGQEGREYWRGRDGRGGWRIDGVVRRYLDILWKYCTSSPPPTRQPLFNPGDDAPWLDPPAEEADGEEGPARKKQKYSKGGKAAQVTSPNLSVIQPHLFHLLRHFVARHTDVRDMVARCRTGDMEAVEKILLAIERKCADGLREYVATDGKSWEVEEAEMDRKTVAKLLGDNTKAGDKKAAEELRKEGATNSSLETLSHSKGYGASGHVRWKGTGIWLSAAAVSRTNVGQGPAPIPPRKVGRRGVVVNGGKLKPRIKLGYAMLGITFISLAVPNPSKEGPSVSDGLLATFRSAHHPSPSTVEFKTVVVTDSPFHANRPITVEYVADTSISSSNPAGASIDRYENHQSVDDTLGIRIQKASTHHRPRNLPSQGFFLGASSLATELLLLFLLDGMPSGLKSLVLEGPAAGDGEGLAERRLARGGGETLVPARPPLTLFVGGGGGLELSLRLLLIDGSGSGLSSLAATLLPTSDLGGDLETDREGFVEELYLPLLARGGVGE
ncbi:tRNA-dihydrouridine(16/17) synthase [NAD(P)(+)] protein-like protein [Zalerion maritima]|uniref:tRNA-dihydrouridine(16/17) synthase [NAD(P)(+)] n=1 Tax=Zalerion maritima TaxID=339359 RepID=A0AAD5RY60_9PEZI|nr:tRNA-dihydrouridine(16/17) synthase [NAD(P)(+)] protein-like protein [Zalerion maritima]